MSYSHCKACHQTVHNSDLELTGSAVRDCGICDFKCSTVDTDTDGDVNGSPPVKHNSAPTSNEGSWEDSASPSTQVEFWEEYTGVIVGTDSYHTSMRQCLVQGNKTLTECISQADRKRSNMMNTENDDG